MYQRVQCVRCGRPRDLALSGTERCLCCGAEASIPIPVSDADIPTILSSLLTLTAHLVSVRSSASITALCAALTAVTMEHDEITQHADPWSVL